MLSILQNIKKEDIKYDPFPHVVIKNALNQKLYDTLSSNFPLRRKNVPKKSKSRVSNKRYDLWSHTTKKIHHKWKKVMAYHTSSEFWLEFVSLFRDAILQCHPNIEEQHKRKLEDFRTTVASHPVGKHEIAIECAASINSPVTTARPTSVRSTHVDNEHELYGALLYMRNKKDNSTGGDLQIFRWKDDERRYSKKGLGINHNMCSLVETVPYEANTMILFINSANSIHGVTPRSRTKLTRKFLTIHGCTTHKLFNVSDKFE